MTDKAIVLIVDDEPAIRRVHERWLTEVGYRDELGLHHSHPDAAQSF